MKYLLLSVFFFLLPSSEDNIFSLFLLGNNPFKSKIFHYTFSKCTDYKHFGYNPFLKIPPQFQQVNSLHSLLWCPSFSQNQQLYYLFFRVAFFQPYHSFPFLVYFYPCVSNPHSWDFLLFTFYGVTHWHFNDLLRIAPFFSGKGSGETALTCRMPYSIAIRQKVCP